MYAFEITSEDFENVLRQNALRVANSEGKPFGLMAEDLFEELQDRLPELEAAALEGGDDLDAQTDAAYAAIAQMLEDQGVLERKKPSFQRK